MSSSFPARKPLRWVGSSKRALQLMPDDVKDVFGSALLDVQYGDMPHGAKPFGERLPREIWKIVENLDGCTYRLAYTTALAGTVYVLDVFMKKSRSGIATPKLDKERVRARFKMAKQHHTEDHR